jgi:CelD/BcsL family acetyltransferase involved in cellulose biosynthesis
MRRLEEAGTVRFERYRAENTNADPAWDIFEKCQQIARRSWQGSSLTGTTITHESIAPFITDVHEVAARTGGLDVNLLYIDDHPVAFAYNYAYRGHVYGLRVGYDPTVDLKGVGNVLYAKIIEDSFQRGDWRYDLGPGSLESKRHLLTAELPIYRLSCFSRLSLRQQLLRWKRQLDMRSQRVNQPQPNVSSGITLASTAAHRRASHSTLPALCSLSAR